MALASLAIAQPALAKNDKNNPGNNGNPGPSGPSTPPAGTQTKDNEPKGSGITLLDADCDLTTGCLFSGNDKDGDAIEEAYETFFPSEDLELDFVVKYEFGDGFYSGTWTSSKPVSYLSVKSSNGFMLYQLPAPTTSGTWSTVGLNNRNSMQQAVSHISLWASSTVVSVPEPRAWALMILGFGAVGAMLRRRAAALA